VNTREKSGIKGSQVLNIDILQAGESRMLHEVCLLVGITDSQRPKAYKRLELSLQVLHSIIRSFHPSHVPTSHPLPLLIAFLYPYATSLLFLLWNLLLLLLLREFVLYRVNPPAPRSARQAAIMPPTVPQDTEPTLQDDG
jgi:hypothetical protein